MPRSRKQSKRSASDQEPTSEKAPVNRRAGVSIDHSQVQVAHDIVGGDQTNIQITEVTNRPYLTGQVLLASIGVIIVAAFALALLLPRLQHQGPMTGLFNIAVAQFGRLDAQGQVVNWTEGSNLSQSIFTRVRDELGAAQDLKGIIQIRYEDVGLVRGGTPVERMAAAKQLATNLNAHLLIYGNLQEQTSTAAFVPEFYVADIKGAEEIVGFSQLGSPITSTASIILSNKLKARSTALIAFTMGLVYLAAKDYDKALQQFDQAVEVKDWPETEGKEVLHLFIGTTYSVRNKEGDLARARAAYEKAAILNPQYARAYIGLGNVFYREFDSSDRRDLTKIDQAAAEYEKAKQATDRPATANVDAKVHISLGNVYVIKGQAGQTEAFVQAQQEFQQVIEPYERGSVQLRPLAATAYLGLGIIQDRWTRDYVQAADFYCKAIAIGEPDNVAAAKQARAQLAVLQLKIQGTITCDLPTPPR